VLCNEPSPVVLQVLELVEDMNVIKVTLDYQQICHGDAALHAGDGTCVSAIPKCPPRQSPKHGTMTGLEGVSEIIPGNLKTLPLTLTLTLTLYHLYLVDFMASNLKTWARTRTRFLTRT
jgi:hypothetical protein